MHVTKCQNKLPTPTHINLRQIFQKYSNIQNPYVLENINNQIFKKGREGHTWNKEKRYEIM